MKGVWNTKQCRGAMWVVLVVIIVGILVAVFREKEPEGAPERGARGDTISGETVPVFE